MSNISLSEFADRLGELMPIIARESMKHSASEFYKVKITMPQLHMLGFLKRYGESRMTDIAKYMTVTTAAITGIVDRLVRDGYVARSHNPKDRRIVKVNLTPKGSGLVEKIDKQRRKIIMNVFSKITQKEREDYLKILLHIKEHLLE